MYKIITRNILILLTFFNIHPSSVHLIIFSKDRPLQLYALLESCQKFLKGPYSISILYAASKENFKNSYDFIAQHFPKAQFIQQNHRNDFKKLTENILITSKNDYCMFAPDDMLVNEECNVNECINALKTTNAHNFQLRMGKNITRNFMRSIAALHPKFENYSSIILSWKVSPPFHSWHYPNNVDMTIYKTSDLLKSISTLHYSSPNTLESEWSKTAQAGTICLCFISSKVINIPLNLVQKDLPSNNSMHLFSASTLLKIFDLGYKMDILYPWHGLKHNAPHVAEYKPKFIKRL